MADVPRTTASQPPVLVRLLGARPPMSREARVPHPQPSQASLRRDEYSWLYELQRRVLVQLPACVPSCGDEIGSLMTCREYLRNDARKRRRRRMKRGCRRAADVAEGRGLAEKQAGVRLQCLLFATDAGRDTYGRSRVKPGFKFIRDQRRARCARPALRCSRLLVWTQHWSAGSDLGRNSSSTSPGSFLSAITSALQSFFFSHYWKNT